MTAPSTARLGIDRIVEHMLAELRAAFPSDPSAPGITIAQVKSARFYAAAARYLEPFGQRREVVAVGRAGDLPGAVRKLAADWSKRRTKYAAGSPPTFAPASIETEDGRLDFYVAPDGFAGTPRKRRPS